MITNNFASLFFAMKFSIFAPAFSMDTSSKNHNKMKQLSFFAMALLLVASIASCKKDTTNGKVVFGNTHGMTVTSYDSTFYIEQYGHFSWGNTVDLDGDGQKDIQFHSENVGSAGLGHDIVTTLHCLNENVALLGDVVNQERYLHRDSTFYTEDSIHWTCGIYINYTCDKSDENDSILSTTEKLALYANNAGDTFDTNSTFMSTNVILKNWSYQYPGGQESIGDTFYWYMIREKNDCDYFPMEEEKYIGFKLTENSKSRLGWMKVILHYDHVELLETAIQN